MVCGSSSRAVPERLRAGSVTAQLIPVAAAPPILARSCCLIFSTLKRDGARAWSSAPRRSGGGSPWIQRSGLMRATTKVRRYGLTKPASLSFSTTSVDALVELDQHARRAFRARRSPSCSGSSENSSSRRTIGLYAPPANLPLLLVADAERHERRFLEVEGEVAFRPASRPRRAGRGRCGSPRARFSRRLCAFSVLSARICQAISRFGTTSAVIDARAEPPHRLRRCMPFGVQKPSFGRGDGDDRIEEHAGAVDHVGELAVMRVATGRAGTASARRGRSAARRAAADCGRAARGSCRSPSPPSRSTRAATSAASGGSSSSLHSVGSTPRVRGAAFFGVRRRTGARLRFAARLAFRCHRNPPALSCAAE